MRMDYAPVGAEHGSRFTHMPVADKSRNATKFAVVAISEPRTTQLHCDFVSDECNRTPRFVLFSRVADQAF